MRLWLAAAVACCACNATVAGWDFAERVAVTAAGGAGIFHHADSAGRRNLAVGARYLAVTWEDNRHGRPAVFVAFKPLTGQAFTREYQLSAADAEAYEPVVCNLSGDRFAIAFEQDGTVQAVIADPQGRGPLQRISLQAGAQATLAKDRADNAWVAWSERTHGRHTQILARPIEAQGRRLMPGGVLRPEREPPATQQLYPALAVGTQGLAVAWEDRRHGHTRIVASQLVEREFTPARAINEFLTNRNAYDRGSGATRVALDRGADALVAVWMDKRERGSGYGIYAAASIDGGRFGPNQRVQDAFGDAVPQSNPALGSSPAGAIVVAWDDAREDDADVWLAWPVSGGWSENFQVPVASGEGEQSNPSVALDADGNLHLIWIERALPGAPTGLWYAFALNRLH